MIEVKEMQNVCRILCLAYFYECVGEEMYGHDYEVVVNNFFQNYYKTDLHCEFEGEGEKAVFSLQTDGGVIPFFSLQTFYESRKVVQDPPKFTFLEVDVPRGTKLLPSVERRRLITVFTDRETRTEQID